MAERISVPTIDNPQFINLQPLDINPLMSSCEIKVFYLGENRNHSYIDEETAVEMAKSLRGAPIVGWFKEDKDDYVDHGDRITIDGADIKKECLTRPYGFVSPDAKVWFQNFEDTDDFGNRVIRKYLMTTGYLWTGQFKEAEKAFEEGGRPQSMELDEKTLDGHWAENINSNMEFFIINSAVISKLCILGKDVEPCFEGSSISAPNVSTSFTLDREGMETLYKMMQDLQFALEGGQKVLETNTQVQDQVEAQENFLNEEDKNEQTAIEENEYSIEGSNEEEQPQQEFKKDSENEEDNNEEEQNESEEKEEDDNEEDKDKKYSLLESEFNELSEKYSLLKDQYNELLAFKNKIEEKEKDDLINSFYMLSDEDKKDVIENKSNYSLDDIEAKLSVICVRKKVNFNLDDETEIKDNNLSQVTTFSLENEESSIPAWITAIKNTKLNLQNK